MAKKIVKKKKPQGSPALELIQKLDKQFEIERKRFELIQYKQFKQLLESFPDKLLIEEVIRMGKGFDKGAPTNYENLWKYAKQKYGDGCTPIKLPKLDKSRIVERMARLRSGYDGK